MLGDLDDNMKFGSFNVECRFKRVSESRIMSILFIFVKMSSSLIFVLMPLQF